MSRRLPGEYNPQKAKERNIVGDFIMGELGEACAYIDAETTVVGGLIGMKLPEGGYLLPAKEETRDEYYDSLKVKGGQ